MKPIVLHCERDGEPITVHVRPPLEEDMRRMIEWVMARPTRHSWLKKMANSPMVYLLHTYQALLEDEPEESLSSKLGASQGRDKTAAMQVGSATHELVLGRPQNVVVYDEEARRQYTPAKAPPKRKPKEGGETVAQDPHADIELAAVATETKVVRNGVAYRAFAAAQSDGVIILSMSEMQQAQTMAAHVLASPRACKILYDGTKLEERIDWEINGIPIHSRPDARRPGEWIGELKTCADNRPSEFERAIFRMLYHSQAECYMQAAQHADGVRPEHHHIVALDRKHPLRIYTLAEETLAMGAQALGAWTNELANSFASMHFQHDDSHIVYPPAHMMDGQVSALPADYDPSDDEENPE